MEDELIALQSIYCLNGELEVETNSSGEAVVTKNFLEEDQPEVKLVLSLHASYPVSPPGVSVLSAELDKLSVKTLRDELMNHAESNVGCPILLELISILHDRLSTLPKIQMQTDSSEDSEKCSDIVTMLLHLDHMRAKSQYVKTVRRWTKELCLRGRLIFCNKLILILLQGSSEDLQEYMVRHKTVNIDVDSQGHPCKEKMMSVLFENKLTDCKSLEEFQVLECDGFTSLQELFRNQGMTQLFDDCVRTIKGFR